MAKKAKKSAKTVATKSSVKRRKRVAWSKENLKELRMHSKAKTAVKKISKLMKRTEGSLRQQAIKLGIPLGHRR